MATNPAIPDEAGVAYSPTSARSVPELTDSAARPLLRAFWPVYVVVVLLFGAYQGINQFISLRSVPQIAPWKPFVWELSSVVVIGTLGPLVVWFENRFRLDSHPRRRIILAHAGAALLFSIAHTTGMVILRKLAYLLAGGHYDFGNVLIQGFYELQKDIITYLTIVLVNFAIREFRTRRARELRARELAAELSEARLRHLTAQIEPHFLFNSLNAISNRMHEDVAAADRMISQLGDLLRAAYESDRQVLVPLERELGWLRGYAAMMAERFRGHLSFQIEVEPGLEAMQVPRLLLQPIVENALRHGLTDGHGWLGVEVRRVGNRLQYTVSDDGAGFPDTPVARGTGISNISRRLELLFPGNHSLEFATRKPRGAAVTVSFPVAV
jgi:signal transduction histidine kinase